MTFTQWTNAQSHFHIPVMARIVCAHGVGIPAFIPIGYHGNEQEKFGKIDEFFTSYALIWCITDTTCVAPIKGLIYALNILLILVNLLW